MNAVKKNCYKEAKVKNKKIASSSGSKKLISTNIVAKTLGKYNLFVNYNNKKVPINPRTGKLISITNRNNLICFEKALIGLKNTSKIKGIGIVLGNTPKGNLCGLDIDNCINEKGVISEEAQKIINYLDSYTELSPSGRGIHILFFAKKKGLNCKIYSSWSKCLEMYDNNRYFTLTGNTINFKGIEYRQKQCDFIYDTYFKQDAQVQDTQVKNISLKANDINLKLDGHESYFKNVALKKDPVLNKYWNGYRSNKSESDDDFAFMGKLLYWLRDIDLAIAFFLASPFAQSKDEYHKAKMYRNDYLRRTALNIISRNKGEFKNEQL